MPRISDLTGQRFGRLLVIKRVENKKAHTMYLCKCNCEKEKIIGGTHLKKGSIKSCGCLRKETHTKHGLSVSKFYQKFTNLKIRCVNKKDKDYVSYGGRGIKCLWTSFEEFKEDMYDSYLEHKTIFGEKNTTIDRKNVNGNYCKENCRWATCKEQNRNRRDNVWITYNGETKIIGDWEKELGIKSGTLNSRLKNGWTKEKTFNTPIKKH